MTNWWGVLVCRFRGHPKPEWGGPGWISTARCCPRCGGSQFYIADPEAHAAEIDRLGVDWNTGTDWNTYWDERQRRWPDVVVPTYRDCATCDGGGCGDCR